MTRAALLAALSLAQSCTLDAGRGFATMTEGELHMALEPSEERDLGDGAFMSDLGYRITPRELGVRVEHVVLLERSDDGASMEPMEPAHCHGDHCHGEEHAPPQEAAGVSPIVEVHVDRALDVIEGEDAALADFEPSAELPECHIEQVEIALTHLHMRADLEGGALTEPAELELDLVLDVPLVKPVSLAIDRDGPEELSLHITIHLDATAVDGLDLATLADEGAVVIDEDSPEAAALTEWLERAEVEVAF